MSVLVDGNTVEPDAVLHADVYDDAQVGVFHTPEKLDQWCKSMGFPPSGESGPHLYICRRVEPGGKKWAAVLLPKDSSLQTIVHECLHAAWHVLDNKGVRVTADNHEALAYLLDHFVGQLVSVERREPQSEPTEG